MNDAELILHLETRHRPDLRMSFPPEGERAGFRLQREWHTYHRTIHRLNPSGFDHSHEEDELEPKARPVNFHERQEEVWVVQQTGGANFGLPGVAVSEEGASQLPLVDRSKPFVATKTILYRPSLAPIYGGPTLLEALWSEMDRLMEALMTGTGAEDGGDKFRAAELAWVLAIVTNAYNPSVDGIRAEAVARWNAANAE